MPVERRLIALIGPPRCGTSALTRGLAVLGVELGDALRPALAGVNDEGFLEDVDIAALNTRLYRELDCEWHRLDAIPANDITALSATDLHGEAVALIGRKLAAHPRFGFKDLHMTRLMPFWARVFDEVGVRCDYVLALRHPASMAASLLKLTGFALAKCHFLWTEYVTAAIAGAGAAPLALIAYDDLLADPAGVLQRLATTLHLPFDADGDAFAAYRDRFLEPRLRHFDASDAAGTPADALALYTLLLPLCTATSDDGRWRDAFEAIRGRHRDAQVVLGAARNAEARSLDVIRGELAASRALLEIDAVRGDGARRHDDLERVLAERDRLLERASQGLSERTLEIVALRETLAERTATLQQREADLRQHIRALGQSGRELVERTDELVATRALLAERTAALQSTSETLVERTEVLHATHEALVERTAALQATHETLVERTATLQATSEALVERTERLESLLAATGARPPR